VNLFNQQVMNYTHKNVSLKLKIALLSNTSPLCGNNVTWIEITLLPCNVVVKQRKYVPNACTEMHRISNLEHITLEKNISTNNVEKTQLSGSQLWM